MLAPNWRVVDGVFQSALFMGWLASNMAIPKSLRIGDGWAMFSHSLVKGKSQRCETSVRNVLARTIVWKTVCLHHISIACSGEWPQKCCVRLSPTATRPTHTHTHEHLEHNETSPSTPRSQLLLFLAAETPECSARQEERTNKRTESRCSMDPDIEAIFSM